MRNVAEEIRLLAENGPTKKKPELEDLGMDFCARCGEYKDMRMSLRIGDADLLNTCTWDCLLRLVYALQAMRGLDDNIDLGAVANV